MFASKAILLHWLSALEIGLAVQDIAVCKFITIHPEGDHDPSEPNFIQNHKCGPAGGADGFILNE